MCKELYLIVGPTGSGKSWLADGLRNSINCKMMVSTTTRVIRPGEKDGVDYYFVNRSYYEQAVINKEFVKNITFGKDEYGITVEEFKNTINGFNDSCLIVEPYGLEQILHYIDDIDFYKNIQLNINILFLNIPRTIRIKNLLDQDIINLNNDDDLEMLENIINRLIRSGDNISENFNTWYDKGLKFITTGRDLIKKLNHIDNNLSVKVFEFTAPTDLNHFIEVLEGIESINEVVAKITQIHMKYDGDDNKNFKDDVKNILLKENVEIQNQISWLKTKTFKGE